MLNVIKMDLYRMFKSKITWIILIVIGLLAVTIMFTAHREHMYFVNNPKDLVDLPSKYAEDPMYSADSVFNIYYFYQRIIYNTFVGLFIAVFSAIFAASENNTGFIKNIAGQPSIRYKTILSKCFSIFVFTIMVLILYFAVAVTCSQLLFGYISFGIHSPSAMLTYALTQLLLNTALGIVVMCISELIRNPAVSMAVSVIISIGGLRLITTQLDDYFSFENFSFTLQLITVNIASLSLPSDFGIYRHAWIVGAVFLVIAVAISIFSMKKRDIR